MGVFFYIHDVSLFSVYALQMKSEIHCDGKISTRVK